MPDPIVSPTTDTTSAREHLNWCVERAMVYYDMNQPTSAIASFMSDVGTHDGTAWIKHYPLEVVAAADRGREEFYKVIDGFAVKG
jgi:hypothetical protein